MNDAKVAHFVHWSRSGITTVVKELCGEFNHSLILLHDDPAFNEYYKLIDHKINLRFSFKFAFSAVKEAIKFCNKNNIEIIHTHSFTPFILASLFLNRQNIIFHVHSEYPYLFNKSLKSKVKRACIFFTSKIRVVKFVSVSTRAANEIKKITQNECEVVLNGVRGCSYPRDSFQNYDDRFRFYSLSRIEADKDIEKAIEIIDQLNRRRPWLNIKYDIYGDGPHFDSIKELIYEKNLGGVVTLKGFIEDIEELPAHYDYYISCSRYEGFGLSMVYAISAGNLLVTTKVGELSNYLTDGKSTNFLCGDVDNCVNKIIGIIDTDNEQKSEMQKNAFDIYYKNFTVDRFFSSMTRVYEGLR